MFLNRKKCLQVLSALLGLLMLLPIPVCAEDGDSLVPQSYFDDTLFVGDSISLQLRNYVKKHRNKGEDLLGKAQFFTRGGFGSGIALQPVTSDSLHPYLDEEKMYVEDAVALSGAKKVYIMLGMNDIVPYGTEGAIQNLALLTDKILEKSPDVELAFQSVTPIMTDKQQRNLNNTSITEYNGLLESFCSSQGYAYLDVASVFRDNDGGLIAQYCGDAPGLGMHIANEGCPPWIYYLRANPITDVEEPEDEEIEVEAEEDISEDLSEDVEYDDAMVDVTDTSDRIFTDYDPDAEYEEVIALDDTEDSVETLEPTQERPKMNISGTATVTSQKPSWIRKKEALLTPRS